MSRCIRSAVCTDAGRNRVVPGLMLAMAVASGVALDAARAETAAQDGVVATVNGEAIHRSELQIMTGLILSKAGAASRDDISEAEADARERLIRAHAAAQAAAGLGLDQLESFMGAMAYQRAVLLERAYYKEQMQRNPLTESSVEQEYTALTTAGKLHEYRLRHILVTHKYRARQIIDQLGRGESFEDLAKLYSSDMATSAAGGEIGWVNLANVDDYRFLDAVRALTPNRHSAEPVQSARGWHVIQLVGSPRPLPKLEGYDALPEPTKAKLRVRAQQRHVAALEARVYADAKVKREALDTREAETGTLGMAK